MRNKSAKKKRNTISDLIDSDDELPTEYIEIPFVPAYQMDNRFEYIEEMKVKEPEEAPKQMKKGLSNAVILGYFNKKDTFCFKCLQLATGKKTQKWFFKYLLLKDLNSSYTFLNSCLVPSYDNGYYSANRL